MVREPHIWKSDGGKGNIIWSTTACFSEQAYAQMRIPVSIFAKLPDMLMLGASLFAYLA